MSDENLINNIPPDLKSMIGKTVKRKMPDGRVIKFVVGDVTGDGKIDDDDIEILKILCEGGPTAEAIFSKLTPEQLSACDTTGDGYINREDLLELCKKIVMKSDSKEIDDKLSDLRRKLKE